MKCPECGKSSRVVDTRQVKATRQRKRICPNEHRFITEEVVAKKWDYFDPRTRNPGSGKGSSRRGKGKDPNWLEKFWEKLNT